MLDDFILSTDYATVVNTNKNPDNGVITFPQGTTITGTWLGGAGIGSREFTVNVPTSSSLGSFISTYFEVLNNSGYPDIPVGYSIVGTFNASYNQYGSPLPSHVDSIGFDVSADKVGNNLNLKVKATVFFNNPSNLNYTVPQNFSVLFSCRLFEMF